MAKLVGAVWRRPCVTRAEAQQRRCSAALGPREECAGPSAAGGGGDAAHELRVTRAANGTVITVCVVCGPYASAAAQALTRPCTRVATDWGRRALAAFAKGRLPKLAGGVRVAWEGMRHIAEPSSHH